MTEPFGTRLRRAIAERGPLCVGIDPHPSLLTAWGVGTDVSGLKRFALDATDAVAGHAAVVKPQSAFFEAYGSQGISVLEGVIERATAAGALVLLDVKRGDIGSTMDAYARAYLADGSPLAVDAITVSPYLGFDTLRSSVDLARETGRGLFVLCRTSNPESPQVQRAVAADGRTAAQTMVDEVAAVNEGAEFGSFGLVIGATVGTLDVDLTRLNGPILAPGYGAQGAGPDELRAVFGEHLRAVLPNSSRDILTTGPSAHALAAAVVGQNTLLRALANQTD